MSMCEPASEGSIGQPSPPPQQPQPATMACGNDPMQPPPARRPDNSNASDTTRLILEIFLRLPSLTTLVRAAFTRRAWRRAVASSPSFRRRFRALHPAPLLGLFFAPFSPAQPPNVPAFPAFAPTRRPDRDLAGAVGSGDFFLTSIQARPGPTPAWNIVDCRDGFVLLNDWDEELLTLSNPLTRRSHGFFKMPDGAIIEDFRSPPAIKDAQLIYSDELPTSFRVVCLAHEEYRVRAAVFSSTTMEWSIHPWVEVSSKPHRHKLWLEDGMQANGLFMYWPFKNRKGIVMLDMTTMEFSVAKLPQCLRNRQISFVVGETKNGRPCIVYANEFCVGVFLCKTDDDGESWVMDRVVALDAQVSHVLGDRGIPDDCDGLNVIAVRNGFAYLATSEKYHDSHAPCWFLSLCLDTMELEKLFQRTFDGNVYPYVMPWLPCLVGDYGRFTCEAAP